MTLSLLDPVEKFEEAFKGCEYLIHTASPFNMNVVNPQTDLVEPAIKGTLSALKAAEAVGIKKVVLTSSLAAITDEPINGKVFSENDWNTHSNVVRNPYYYSKTCAEREAWKFVEALPEDKKIKLVAINVLFSLLFLRNCCPLCNFVCLVFFPRASPEWSLAPPTPRNRASMTPAPQLRACLP